ncbi:hypothetical protein SGRI78S_03329 [Streptomyces griseus subsp. griseus]
MPSVNRPAARPGKSASRAPSAGSRPVPTALPCNVSFPASELTYRSRPRSRLRAPISPSAVLTFGTSRITRSKTVPLPSWVNTWMARLPSASLPSASTSP